METEFCIECEERPVEIKQRRLCRRCYLRWWKKENLRGKPRLCIVCSKEIKDRAHKYCPNCKPSYKHNPNLIAHSKAAQKWQKRNPKKHKCARFAQYYKQAIRILYECPCNNGKKHDHHFDYDRPLEAIRLCHKCHRLEHERLRRLVTEPT